jgi:hypothetical protein
MRGASLAVGFACAVLVVGCGGSGRLSHDAYRGRLAAMSSRITVAQTRSQNVVTGARSVAEIRSALRDVAEVYDRVGDTAAQLKPPKDAEAANALYARGAHDLAAEIRAVLPRLAKLGSPSAALALLQRELGNARGAHELGRAVSQLKRKGYVVSS